MSIQNTYHNRTIICIELHFFVYYTHYIVQQYYNRTFIIYISLYIHISNNIYFFFNYYL